MMNRSKPNTPNTRPWRPIRARVVLAALLVTASVFAGAGGASAQGQEDDGKALDQKAAAAEDVKIIAKTFGWDPNETAAHMEGQLVFGELINQASIELREVYGGAVYGEKPGEPAQIMVKGEAPQVLRLWAEKSGLKIELVEGMKYSEEELVKRSDALVDLLGESHDEVTSAVLPSGEIQVAVSGKLDPRVKIPEELLDGVSIVAGPEDLANPEADIIGGVQVYGASGQCTSGFSVRSNSTGTEGVSTAGHCFGINRFSAPGTDPTLFHQGEHKGTWGDVEWKTAPGHNVLDDFQASPTSYRDVSTVWPAGGYAVNMVTCVHSRMQSTRTCDQIYSTNTSVKYSGEPRMSNMVATDNDNTVPGDSGTNWSYSTIADGIHSGDKWIWFGTRNVFSKAGNMPNALGVSVMTSP